MTFFFNYFTENEEKWLLGCSKNLQCGVQLLRSFILWKKMVWIAWPPFKDEASTCLHEFPSKKKNPWKKWVVPERRNVQKNSVPWLKCWLSMEKLEKKCRNEQAALLKWSPVLSNGKQKQRDVENRSKNSKNGKDSASDQCEGDQRRSEVTLLIPY